MLHPPTTRSLIQPWLALLQGTIEYARQQLESYRNQLENRVVSRFDAAEARRDLAAMAACARVMREFEKSSSATSLVQVLLPTPQDLHMTGSCSFRWRFCLVARWHEAGLADHCKLNANRRLRLLQGRIETVLHC